MNTIECLGLIGIVVNILSQINPRVNDRLALVTTAMCFSVDGDGATPTSVA
jgi:hypothetical protein